MAKRRQEITAYLLLLLRCKDHTRAVSAKFDIVNICLGLDVCEKRSVFLVPYFNDFAVTGQHFFRLFVELDLSNWKTVVMRQSLQRQGIPDVVFDYSASFSANPEVKAAWFELNLGYFFAVCCWV